VTFSTVQRLTAELKPSDTPGLPRPTRPVRLWLYLQAVLYAAAAWGALRAALAGTRPIVGADLDAGSSFPWLREFVLGLGIALAGLGAILGRRGLGHPRHRDLPAAPPALRPVLHRLWHVGAVTRGVMLLVPGLLLVLEAWTYRRGSFGRITEQVRQALQTPWGRLLLLVTAVGLAAFALAEVAAAVYRRETPDDTDQHSVPAQAHVPWWAAAGVLLTTGALLWGVLVTLGHLIAAVTPATGRRGEGAVDAWFAAHRTPQLNHLSAIGSGLADTMTCITVAGIAATVFALWLGRWREPIVLILAIAGELLLFVLVTAAVHRARPGVVHLDPAPPTSSFPSGHTGAAIALYGCITVIVLREVTRRLAAVAVAAVLCAIPLAVALSRLYRGMHYPTDVLAGAAAGGAWLTLVVVLLLAPPRRALPLLSTPARPHLEVAA
jgi:membrane-associated phospholipid phosphatase